MAYTRPKLLQEVIRRDFEQRISNEEHHKRNPGICQYLRFSVNYSAKPTCIDTRSS